MTQKKDSTKKLKSISTGNLCSVAQYVAEKVCLRKAEKDNNGSLEYKFWSKSKNEQYEIQVRAAWKLIKKHGEDALLKYINSPSGRNVYSLGFLHKSGRYVLILKFVEKGVANAAKLVEKESKKPKKVLDTPDKIDYKQRKLFNGGSTLFSKIRNIEDGKRKET
jgi:hypothetical protein